MVRGRLVVEEVWVHVFIGGELLVVAIRACACGVLTPDSGPVIA
jgi:hypothetical protein